MHTSSVVDGDSGSLARLYRKLCPAPRHAQRRPACSSPWKQPIIPRLPTNTSPNRTHSVGIAWLPPDWHLRTGVRFMEFGTFYQLPCAADNRPRQRYEDTLMKVT